MQKNVLPSFNSRTQNKRAEHQTVIVLSRAPERTESERDVAQKWHLSCFLFFFFFHPVPFNATFPVFLWKCVYQWDLLLYFISWPELVVRLIFRSQMAFNRSAFKIPQQKNIKIVINNSSIFSWVKMRPSLIIVGIRIDGFLSRMSSHLSRLARSRRARKRRSIETSAQNSTRPFPPQSLLSGTTWDEARCQKRWMEACKFEPLSSRNLIIYLLGLHGSLEYVSGIPPGICCSKVKGRVLPQQTTCCLQKRGKIWRLCFCSFAKLASGFLASSELTVISVIICRDSGKKSNVISWKMRSGGDKIKA